MNSTDKNELLNRYGQIQVTQAMAQVLEQMPTAGVHAVMETILYYAAQLKQSLSSGSTIVDAVETLYDAGLQVHDTPPVNLSCRKGCAHCCHIQVMVTTAEAKTITQYCKQHDIPIDYSHLKKQRDFQEGTHGHSEHSACVFLKNNECSIYPVRPFNCRNYFVVSDPKLCDVKANPRTQVLKWVDMNLQIFHSALLMVGVDGEQDSLARIFLKLKK